LVPLIDLIEQVTGPLQLTAFQKNIEFSLNMPSNIRPLIQVDKALFQQVIYNLVENALKYTPDGGRVALSLRVINNDALFEVQDSGIGVDDRDKPRLFEKFYRSGQRQAREQKGSGLGLAIVKTITEVHGGKVWFESQIGKGSTFYLQVPLRQLLEKAE
jgi:signal transduction histidine kinase